MGEGGMGEWKLRRGSGFGEDRGGRYVEWRENKERREEAD
jgi:hypothetical protein